MKKESKRHKERELALWGIFQEDFNLDGKNEKIDCFIEDYPEEEMNSEIAEELALPPVKIHCSILAEDAIKAAVDDYKKKHAQ